MFLSNLLVDVGDNPDRPRPGRLWLRNLYHVHQRLCMAFPSAPRRLDDPEFLRPYAPGDFPEDRFQAEMKPTEAAPDDPERGRDILRHVHTPRDAQSSFLFRIDPHADGSPTILVQSTIRPDWEYAFHNADFLLAAPAATREFDPSFSNGLSLRFRLVANPTRKIGTKSGPDGKRDNGQRVPVKYELLPAWLDDKGMDGGFKVKPGSCTYEPGYVYWSKPDKKSARLFSVRYDGLLEVTDAGAFVKTLVGGIGPAKAFGFGLLSVAPVRM